MIRKIQSGSSRRIHHTEVASVGLTEAQCDDEELDYKAVKVPFGAVGKAVAMGEPDVSAN